jgi:hypothetical protein
MGRGELVHKLVLRSLRWGVCRVAKGGGLTEKEIYKQTQRLAAMDGWDAVAADFRHDSENPVGRRYFAMAADIFEG